MSFRPRYTGKMPPFFALLFICAAGIAGAVVLSPLDDARGDVKIVAVFVVLTIFTLVSWAILAAAELN